jgi:hypothetical protein
MVLRSRAVFTTPATHLTPPPLTLHRRAGRALSTAVDVYDLGRAPYDPVYRLMMSLHKERCDAILAKRPVHELPRDVLLCVEHEPVFTLGRKATLEHLRFDPASPPYPVRLPLPPLTPPNHLLSRVEAR